MRYVVGYTADDRGRNAVDLALTFARGQKATLTLVMVLPPAEPFQAVYPPERDFEDILAQQAQEWLLEGVALVPEGIAVTAEIRYAHSFAEGLMAAAVELRAAMIVIGTAKGGLFHRSTVGNVANGLLHASTTPVAIAPLGYGSSGAISRITCAVGSREGAEAILEVGLTSCANRGIPLRIISLLALGAGAENSTAAVERAQAHADSVKAEALEVLPAGSVATAQAAHGATIEDAVESLDWDEHEIVIVGSSRLAERQKLFLGSTANKMLRALPVPMVVVPRRYSLPGHLNPFVTDDTRASEQHREEGGTEL
ncbi:universal stress protein [Klugiella xanthotipulae]|uniref:Nucleotide-binding universal stress UspA family protein n=1 Tax=Klugiella xanthotipulae TaxID=244735 RepID=A0A543HXH6_9MICO|nr:universal stress protein [Klugiella xanthotipulae]TQM63052.1 nucleotide-binding universal stress UspA family protein [Klugiella xanthotipulae]